MFLSSTNLWCPLRCFRMCGSSAHYAILKNACNLVIKFNMYNMVLLIVVNADMKKSRGYFCILGTSCLYIQSLYFLTGVILSL